MHIPVWQAERNLSSGRAHLSPPAPREHCYDARPIAFKDEPMVIRRAYWLIPALLLLASPPSRAFDIDLQWMRLTRTAQLDAPESPDSASSGALYLALEGGEPQAHRTLLSTHQGLYYLNLYRDADYRERSHKLGPLPLFNAEEFRRCRGQYAQPDISSWAGEFSVARGLLLLGYSVYCPGPEQGKRWEDDRFVLVDGRSPGAPLLALGRATHIDRIELQPLQPLPTGRSADWLALLNGEGGGRHYSLPSQPTRFTLAQANDDTAAAADRTGDAALRELRRLHGEAFARKGDAQSLAPLREFLMQHDYRQIGSEARDVPRLLNDIAFWLDAAGDPQAARPLLLEVLRREPERVAVQLNLADIDWKLHLGQPDYSAHPARAQERYRLYCSRRLALGLSVPERVVQRLEIDSASERACRPHWPLLDAIAADDLALVERLLGQGIPGQVVGDDGRTALSLALRKPNFQIAERLIAAGARLDGRYASRTQLGLALQQDLGEDPQLQLAARLRFLIEAGAPLEEPELNDRHLLLQHAGNPRELAIFAELLRHPQDVDRRDKDGENALARALSAGNFQAADMLIAAGAQVNQLYDGRLHCESMDTRYSPLQLLAQSLHIGHYDTAEYRRASLQSFASLLALGADLGQGQRCGLKGESMLLARLTVAGRADLIELLDNFGPPRSPLDYRVSESAIRELRQTRGQEQRQEQVWKALLAALERGVPINPPSAPGSRSGDPELLAAQQTWLPAERYAALLQQGADPWASNARGQSALLKLVEEGREEHLQALAQTLQGRPQYASQCARPLLDIADSLTRSGRSASPATRALVTQMLATDCDPLEDFEPNSRRALAERLSIGLSRLDDAELIARLEQRLKDLQQ